MLQATAAADIAYAALMQRDLLLWDDCAPLTVDHASDM